MPKEKITISVRIDKDKKEQFESICKAIGLNASDAINVFVRKVISENGIPFPVRMNKG
ncbi:MAG: type II toxin-antitoxin system RelB/DinJ family antitoxin [Clostridia bacterium]|nr:type II toxin-antitoxin system RelB/DinJ family antitoxin [Clostridia bacterium]